MKQQDREKHEARERLLEWLKPGDVVYTIVRHVSRSGMQREIGIVVFLKGDDGRMDPIHPNHAVGTLLGWRVSKGEAVIVGGCGMDMGFHLVYELSTALFGDGYALKQEWL